MPKRLLPIVQVAFYLFIVTTISISAQPKVITSSEYFSGLYPRSGVRITDRSRRVELIDETMTNGAVTKSVQSVSEFLLPDHNRYYKKTTQVGKVDEYEAITIDYMFYSRKDSGAWTKVDLRQAGNGGGMNSSGAGYNSCSQHTVDSVFLNGVAVKLFESLDITSPGGELKYHERKDWIGEEGLVYRREQSKGTLYPRTETYKELVTYDYNASIKIEAPIK